LRERSRTTYRTAAVPLTAHNEHPCRARFVTNIIDPQKMRLAASARRVLASACFSKSTEVDMSGSNNASVHERWAAFRFSVVGQLLAAPPLKGTLRRELKQLAARQWRHPVTGAPVRFGLSTIERWYRRAKRERQDPLRVLRRKVRKDLGSQGSMSLAIRQALLTQYASYPNWSVLLHYENLRALAEASAGLQPIPSYSTIQRFFKTQGLRKRRRQGARDTDGAERAEARLAAREMRSYEAEYVGGLVH
jgi:hypothetical protein